MSGNDLSPDASGLRYNNRAGLKSPALRRVTGKFYSGSGEETTETEILAAISDNTPETSVNLGLSGKPEPFAGSQKIGSVTVWVQEAGTPDDEE